MALTKGGQLFRGKGSPQVDNSNFHWPPGLLSTTVSSSFLLTGLLADYFPGNSFRNATYAQKAVDVDLHGLRRHLRSWNPFFC